VIDFVHTQLPMLVVVASLALFVAIATPAAFLLPWFLTGMALTVLATVLAVAIPWERIGPRWRIIVPLVDVAAIAFFREADYTAYPSISILIILPVLWLAYSFSRRALIFAMVASFGVFLFPFARVGALPSTTSDWAAVTLVPFAICVIAFAVWTAANTLRTNQERLGATSSQLQASLSATVDDKSTLDAVLDTVEAGIVLYSPAGTPILWNASSLQLAKKAGLNEDYAKTGFPLVFAADRTTVLGANDQISAVGVRGELTPNTIFWMGPKDDQTAVIATSQKVRRADGVSLGTVVVSSDVTALVDSIAVRDEFLTTITHELITPLTSILGYLELTRAGDVSVDAGLDVIERNASRLRALISDLVDVDGDPHVDREPHDLAAIVGTSVDGIRVSAASASIDIRCTLAATRAAVDPAAISQVLDNVLSNAVKFTPHGGLIAVAVEGDAEWATISVTDTGIGISPGDQRQIFDRFFRASSSHVNAIAGAGLGLAIAKSLVDAHRGTITLTSAIGSGTTVSVRLPRELAESPRLDSAIAVPAATPPVPLAEPRDPEPVLAAQHQQGFAPRAVRRRAEAGLPPPVTDKHGDTRATPRIISAYYPNCGWDDTITGARLTAAMVTKLHADGATLIRTKWRSRHHQFALCKLLPAGSDAPAAIDEAPTPARVPALGSNPGLVPLR
jgi:signal transduction histidine kinase